MENNNYLSSGVNYIPLTVLDKQNSLFITANGGAYDPLAFDDINVGSNGRYCFGFADPSQFRFYNASTGEYNVAGIAKAEEDSGIFINNTGERGIQVWLYFGDNYDQDEAVLSVGEGSDGYTPVDGGTIGYWQKYAYIRPHERATIPWIKDDEVGTQSTRMYFQYRNGNVSASSYEEWDGSGGTHNREWTYSTSTGYNYGSTDLVPLTYNNLIELEQNSFDAGLDAIAIRCMAVQGSLLLDSTPMDGRVDKDVLIKDTDSDVYVDNLRSGDIFDGKLWGPISSDYYEIDDLLYATPNGTKVTWGMTLDRVISGDAQSRSHFLLNGLEINPQTVVYNSATDQTTFSIQISWPDEMYGGSEGVDIVSFEHYFARIEAEVVSGFVEGSYIAGATVEAKSKSGEMISTITDEFGYYEFNEPVVGTITAKGGYSTITGEIIDDNTSDDIISTGDLTTIQAPRKTHSNLGGIINSATSIMAELMDKQAMNKQEAISAFRESAVTLYDLESDVTDNDLDQYMRIGLAGLQNSTDNDVQTFAKMTKLIKAVSEGEQSFADGGTSNNSSSKAKRKVANIYRKNLVDVIAKGASGKIVEVATSYNTEVGGDSNLGSISNSDFNQNSKEDLIYLINAKAIEEVDSKITSTDKNLENKAAWKDTSKVLADSLAANRYDDAASVKDMTYEEIFVHYNEKAMQRKQGARNLFNRKRQNVSISTSDFASKLNNDSFRINITGTGYDVNGSIVTSRGDSISKSDSVNVKYSDSNVSQRNAKISKQGSIIELNKGKDAGEVYESEETRDVTTLVFGTGFAKGVYLIGNTTTLAYHNISQHEVIVNDEFFTKIGNTLWDGQTAAQWFSDNSFSEWYPDKVGVGENDLYASTFKGKYKVIYGPNIKVKDENGNLRNWNIVDYRTGRNIVSPGSIEELQLLEYIYEIFTHSNGLTSAPADLYNIIKGAYDSNSFRDSDGDGVGDNVDAFPNDASEFADSDEDGVGDNLDKFPNDPTKTEHTPFAYTIDTTLAGDSLTQRFGTGLYHNLAAQTPVTLDNDSKKIKIDWGEGAGWEYYGSGDSVEGRNLYNTQRYNFEHTYAEHGTYQIRVSFEDVIEVYPNVLTQILPQGIGGWSYSIGATDSAKRVTSIDSWGDTNTVRLFTPQGLYIYLENCKSWPSIDNLPIVEVLADAYQAPWIPSTARVIYNAKYLTSFNASDWNWTTGSTTQVVDSGRYFYRWANADRLQTLNLDNLEYDSFSNAYFDDTGYFGSLVPNGTLVSFNNVTIDNGDTNPYVDLIYYLRGRIHKDSTFNNVSINNSGDFGWRTSITGGAHIITDESSYTYEQKNWIDTSGASKKLKVNDLPYFNIKDSSGNDRNSGVDVTVDLSSPNGWELSGSMQDKWGYGPISQNHTNSLTILGTDNWDTSSVTSWYRFFIYLNSSVEVDMDISSWSFEGSPSFRLNNLKSEQYTKALIAWAASEPSYSATINMGVSQYNQTAHAAKMSLINDYGWTFTDAGLVFDSNETMPTNFVYNATAQANSDEACSLEATSDTAYFFPSSGEYPVVGDWIFTSLNGGTGGTAIIEGSGTYKIESEADYSSHITLDSMGKVTGIGDCSAPEPSSVQYNYGNADRGQEGACSAESLDGTFYVAEEIGEAMPSTLYSDAALTKAIDFSRSVDGYYPFQLNGSSTRKTFNLSRGKFGAVSDCR